MNARLNSIKHVLKMILAGRRFTERESEDLKRYFADELRIRTAWAGESRGTNEKR